MKHGYLVVAAIFAFLASPAVWAQETNTKESQTKNRADGLVRMSQNQDSLKPGLKKIYSHRDKDGELSIDLEGLDAAIEAAVDRAMKSVDHSLRHLEIPAMDINIPEIEIPEIDIPEIKIPAINIHIPEIHTIDIDLKDIDVDIDVDEEHRHHDGIKMMDQPDKIPVKSDDKEKDKRKGLKKVN